MSPASGTGWVRGCKGGGTLGSLRVPGTEEGLRGWLPPAPEAETQERGTEAPDEYGVPPGREIPGGPRGYLALRTCGIKSHETDGGE